MSLIISSNLIGLSSLIGKTILVARHINLKKFSPKVTTKSLNRIPILISKWSYQRNIESISQTKSSESTKNNISAFHGVRLT